MGRKLKLSIDHLPYRELSPNARLHWTEKRAYASVAREQMGWLSKSEWHDDKPMMKARISYEFHIKDHHKRDLDNLLSACKSWQDGLIDAGVIFFDDSEHLEIGSIKLKQDNHEETIIKVEEL